MKTNGKLLLFASRKRPWTLSYTTTASPETATINLTWAAGGTFELDWGDGTTSTVTSGVQATHDYASPGTYTCKIPSAIYWDLTRVEGCSSNCAFVGDLQNAPSEMTYLTLGNTQSVITGSLADLPSGMTYLYLGNTQSVITGSLADLPSGMTYLYLFNIQSTITGSLADLPSGMIQLFLNDTQSVITGSLADIPSVMTYVNLGNTQSNISGGSSTMQAVGIGHIISYSSETQSNLDDLLHRLYEDRALFTYAAPYLNIAGINPAPSGVYQDASPPTTGLEYVYKLANDPDGEGFNKWTIYWNGGSAP